MCIRDSPWSTSSPQDTTSWLLSISAFVLMFPMFVRIPLQLPTWGKALVEVMGYGAGIVMLLTVPYTDGRSFDLACSDIIILVLANMALWGSLAYLFTCRNKWFRIGILPFLMAIFLGSTTERSWQQIVMNYSPCPWMFQFNFLKYLFIVIPGTIAGEYLKVWIKMCIRDRNPNRLYEMTLFTDGLNAGLQALDYKKEVKTVSKAETLKVKMVRNGGFATVLK